MGVLQWMSVDVKEHLKSNQPFQIIDVRQPNEFENGHIPGATLIPLGELSSRYSEINRETEALVVCRSGGRSTKACEFLGSVGYRNIYNLMGGMLGWDGDVE